MVNRRSDSKRFSCFSQRLKQQERSVSGGVMLDKPKSMCFQDGGGNLVVTVDDIGANWRSKPQDNYKVRIAPLLRDGRRDDLGVRHYLDNP